MRTTSAVLVALVSGVLFAPAVPAAPRIVFERVLPASHDLGGARDLAKDAVIGMTSPPSRVVPAA